MNLNLKDLADIKFTVFVDTESIIKIAVAAIVVVVFAGVFSKVMSKV